MEKLFLHVAFDHYLRAMLRRGVIFVILISMMLHCAARMNFLSFVYEQRQQIAFNLGLLDEIPMTTCHHDYEFDKGIVVVTPDTHESNLPSTFSHAREITLFIVDVHVGADQDAIALKEIDGTPEVLRRYSSPALSIFHPPS